MEDEFADSVGLVIPEHLLRVNVPEVPRTCTLPVSLTDHEYA